MPFNTAVTGGCVAATPADEGTLMLTVGAAFINIANCCVTGGSVGAGIAAMMNVELPLVGVPLITPVVAFRVRPAGSDPEATLQVTIVVPATVNVVAG